MNHILRRAAAALLCLALLCTALPVFAGQSDWDVTLQFLHGQAKVPSAANTYGDWEVFALARTGAFLPDSYYAAYLTLVERALEENGGKLPGALSGNLRLAMALLALGQDLSNVGGYDLTALILDTDRVCKTTVMGPTFGLLLLNNMGGNRAAEQVYLQHLKDKQLPDGGWALSGQISDPDATAMALQALSFYQNDPSVQAMTATGLARLASLQLENGGFTAWGATTSESIAQTILALCMLDIDLSDPRFVKNGTDLLEALLTFRLADGSFRHTMDGGYDIMATEQAMLALDALRRREEGLPKLYQLTDIRAVDRSSVGLPGKDPAITVPGKTVNIPTFPDVAALPAAEAILSLAHRGILNGMGDGSFQPKGLLNRAQFCAMVVRGLGLPAAASAGFTDVSAGQWYTDPINRAAAFGAVNGMGNGTFAPTKTITRQEAATLMARLAAKCGLRVNYDAAACRNVLSQFGDYRTCAAWAQEGLAFCYDNGILDSSVLNIRPNEAVSRAEAAAMFHALLDAALLLED